MIAEDISACDWGQSRLTVAPNTASMTTRSHKNNLSGKNSTESRSCSSQGCTSRKSKMGFTTNCQYQNIRCTNCVFTGKLQASRSDRILPSTTSTNHRTSFFNMHRVSQIVLFSLLTLCSWTSATFTDKGPLVETDATKRDDFRYFMSDIGASEMVMSRSSVAASLEDPVDSLGFQTLKVLDKWGNDTRDILLVAGKDHVYMLDSTLTHDQPEISYMERLTWRTHTDAKNECKMLPGQQPELCENFIRFVELMDNGELMVCGTNAYSPACRFYKREQFSDKGSDENSNYARENKCRGQCFVPYNPLTASAALSVDTENGRQIFMAVVNDFRSNEPKIMRQDKPTLLSNSLWLNDPTFLKILEYKDKVYVFFREVAKESESERGGDEQVTFARVAQVCKDDPGGVNILAQQWTSFLKARLRCGYPTRQYLQFNNLTSVTDIVNITDESGEIMDVVFATFTTPWEWQDASLSAVCAFSMKDIIKVFEEGSFSGEYELNAQPDVRSAYPRATPTPVPGVKTIKRSYPIPKDKEPVPRPGGCLKTYTPNVLFFAKEHPLMYDVIEPYGSAPLFVSNNNLRATQVAADTNAGESEKLMIYIGTEEGNVLRLRGMLTSGDNPKAMLIESVKVSDEKRCEQNGCGVRSLHVSRPPVDHTNSKPSAFVAFTDYMVQFPLVRCSIFKSKECCSIDPDCGWDGNEQCVQRTAENSASLIPTSKDTDKIPEACNAIDRTPTEVLSESTTAVGVVTELKPDPKLLNPANKGGVDNEAVAQASAGGLLIVSFFGGLLLGILIMVVVIFTLKQYSKRRRKHTINSKPKMKKIKRHESGRDDEVKEKVVEDRASNYMEMTKSPEHKYPLPPSPSPSEGDPQEYKKTKTKSPKKYNSSSKSPKMKSAPSPETVPLVGKEQSSPTKSQSSEPEATKTATPEKKSSTSQHVSHVEENPNANNSNNRYFATNFDPIPEPLPPPLPVKASSMKRKAPQKPFILPVEPQPTPRKVTIPSRKIQSFAGYDRVNKPPVPQKSHLAKAFADRNLRPHSLAPPKSVKQIEDIPMPVQSHSMTPPATRSQKSLGSFNQLNQQMVIPKRRERPPSFRHNSAVLREVRSPVPVASPVAPVLNSRSPDKDPLLFQY